VVGDELTQMEASGAPNRVQKPSGVANHSGQEATHQLFCYLDCCLDSLAPLHPAHLVVRRQCTASAPLPAARCHFFCSARRTQSAPTLCRLHAGPNLAPSHQAPIVALRPPLRRPAKRQHSQEQPPVQLRAGQLSVELPEAKWWAAQTNKWRPDFCALHRARGRRSLSRPSGAHSCRPALCGGPQSNNQSACICLRGAFVLGTSASP